VDCWRAVAFAAILAERSIKRDRGHAKTPGGELLLRLAGTHQIKEAIKAIGAREGYNYLVVFGSREDAERMVGELGLEEVELEDCPDEELKKLFEKSALVEVL
jgi:KEOPS complex subunit Cgi121